MARAFDLSVEYPVPADRVYAALRDEHYWTARLADSRADIATLDSLTANADGIEAVTTQALRRDRLPALVTQFHRGDLQITRTEKWGPIGPDGAAATVTGQVPGAPVTLAGSGGLTPAAGGCRLTFKVNVEVKIPLVGGKIEGFIGGKLMDLLAAEQRFTSQWIAEHS